jgi:hypothetical protein
MNGPQKILMETEHFNKGIYIIELDMEGQIYQKKIVKL